MRQAIQWELREKFTFDHTNKWYMHNPESVKENAMHKILWNFEIQTYYLISPRRPDLVIVNNNKKKKMRIVDFAFPVDHRLKPIEIKKRNK